MKRIFIAGPMSGYPEWNYPAFDDAAHRIRETHGRVQVYNPAENHNRQTDLPRWMYISKTMDQIRSLANIAYSSSDECLVAVLPGWERSKGARLEAEAAHQLGLPIYGLECILSPHWEDSCCIIPSLDSGTGNICEEPHETIEEEDACEDARALEAETAKALPVRAQILDEAKRLVTGDRNSQYGPPTQDFARTANLLNDLGFSFNDELVRSHHIAIIMIALKLSRLTHQPGKRDTLVDIAGYAACGRECVVDEGLDTD